MTVVVGTAGHIDHGKTTLLRALTGIDADRLPEERARGMTIDVGYAHLALDDGTELDFVDVPGHDRLVGNMLVGAGEIDAALLVVAADDGPRAQTIEHLELLDALGIDVALAVVTKTDVVPSERVADVANEVATMLAGTTLAGAPVLAASATSGTGLDEVRAALRVIRDRLTDGPTDRTGSAPGLARLAIDRVFSIRGRGTVVTGTLRGGTVERGALLRVVPDPAGRAVRVREVQVHGRSVERAGPGRVALNVAGSAVAASLERGTVLTVDPAVVATDRVLVAIRPPAAIRTRGQRPSLPADRSPIAIHLGTARVDGRLGRSGRDGHELGVGSSGAAESSAILRLDRPIATAPGDRFVLRRPSPAETVAAGRVVDPLPPRGVARRRATPERISALAAALPGSGEWLAARLDLHGWILDGAGAPPALADDVGAAIDARLLEVLSGRDAVRTAELIAGAASSLRRLVGRTVTAVAGQGLAERAVAIRLETLIAGNRLARNGGVVRLAGLRNGPAGPSPAESAAMDRLVAALAAVSPPALADAARAAGCSDAAVRELERTNRIVRLEPDLAWAAETWRELAGRALAMAATAPLSPAAFRDATGSSRKFVMAILEDLDRRAILRRTPVGHVPGPRAASGLGVVPEPAP
ncbi:MAG TPA: selenocysteine-specific translation elongation factor [Patescibacteria group bacterium]|nr:selenocysteine-specific translation elongation factor [Patescibacteria group bacterium]